MAVKARLDGSVASRGDLRPALAQLKEEQQRLQLQLQQVVLGPVRSVWTGKVPPFPPFFC
jgi:hypothetical protein